MSTVFATPPDTAQIVVEVPRDVEDDVVQHFLAYGLDAQSELGRDRVPGMVRVTRVGGDIDPDSPSQDAPRILVEAWAETGPRSWGLAITAWALLAIALEQHTLNGVELYDADLDVPRTLDDDYAPELHRHQFVAVLRVPLTEMEITMEGPSA